MNMIEEILLILSSGALGIFLGAQIAEAVLFVPYWKTLSADDFFEQHKIQGKKMHRFFAPLTTLATVLPLSTVVYTLMNQPKEPIIIGLMGISTILFFSSYFLYFKKANTSFAERSITNEELPFELVKWGNWHWGRIFFEFIAFSCSLILLLKS